MGHPSRVGPIIFAAKDKVVSSFPGSIFRSQLDGQLNAASTLGMSPHCTRWQQASEGMQDKPCGKTKQVGGLGGMTEKLPLPLHSICCPRQLLYYASQMFFPNSAPSPSPISPDSLSVVVVCNPVWWYLWLVLLPQPHCCLFHQPEILYNSWHMWASLPSFFLWKRLLWGRRVGFWTHLTLNTSEFHQDTNALLFIFGSYTYTGNCDFC